jgi:hypothetical protein
MIESAKLMIDSSIADAAMIIAVVLVGSVESCFLIVSAAGTSWSHFQFLLFSIYGDGWFHPFFQSPI